MTMGGYLLGRQRDRLDAAGLADQERAAAARSHVERHSAAQIGQRERALAVAAIGRADQGEQGLILGNRQQRPVAEAPAVRIEIAPEHADFADEWSAHDLLP